MLYSAARLSLKSWFLFLLWLWDCDIFLLPHCWKLCARLSASSNSYLIPSPNHISGDFLKCGIKWFWPYIPLHWYPPAFVLLQTLFIISHVTFVYLPLFFEFQLKLDFLYEMIFNHCTPIFFSSLILLIFKPLSYLIYAIHYQLF